MSWITVLWSMNAGICLSLGLVHLIVWLQMRYSLASILFSMSAVAAATIAVLELSLMRAQTPAQAGEVLRWMHVPAAIIVITVVWFVRNYLRTGRVWLAWLITGIRAVVLLVNFLMLPNATFREITSLRPVLFMRETLSIPVGVMNPWRWLIQLSMVLFLVYTLDASISSWKQGNRLRSIVLGGAICAAIILGAVSSNLMVRGILPGPCSSIAFLLIVLAMAFELSMDLVRVSLISRELRDNQARMSLAAAAADLSIWEWDVVSDEIWTTEKSRERFNLGETERMTSKRFLESVFPGDRESIQEAMQRSLEGGDELEVVYRVITEDRVTRWIEARGRVVRDNSGKPLCMHGISIDITNRKHMEESLKASEDRLKEAQRMAKLGSWELDLVMNKLIWSDEIFRIFEIDKERFDASYEFFLSTIHPEDREAVNAAYTQSLETRKPYAITHRLIMQDGRIKYVHEQCQTFYSPDGEPLRSVGTVQDITESKKSEQAIIAAEKRYRTVANFTHAWEYWEGPNNEILYMSPSCKRVTGYSNDDFIANPQLLEQLILAVDKNIWVAHRYEAENKDKPLEIQFRIITKDGSIRWIEHVCQPVFYENSEFQGFRVSNRDITERKKGEEALEKSQKSLQYLAGRLITIQEEKHRQLAREMHDDLTQRLALLAIEVRRLEIENQQHGSPICTKLESIRKEITKLSKDIHDMSRQIHPAILDDLGLVDAIRSECDVFSDREEIYVEYKTKNIPSSVPRDVAICIYRVTQESLRNIAKHAGTGKAFVSLVGHDSHLVLTIRDTGVGFDTAHRKSQKGIGLKSIRERIRLVNGDLTIKSKPGLGTVIKVIVPYAKELE